MNASQTLTKIITDLAESLSNEMKSVAAILPKVGHLEFEDDRTRLTCYNKLVTIVVYTREDLQTTLSLLPGVWKKESYYGEGLLYSNWEGKNDAEPVSGWNSDFRVEVIAKEAALPATCVMEEVTVVEEARPARPARTYTTKKLKCITGVEQADAAIEEEVKI